VESKASDRKVKDLVQESILAKWGRWDSNGVVVVMGWSQGQGFTHEQASLLHHFVTLI
jgi:hypothetical protein